MPFLSDYENPLATGCTLIILFGQHLHDRELREKEQAWTLQKIKGTISKVGAAFEREGLCRGTTLEAAAAFKEKTVMDGLKRCK